MVRGKMMCMRMIGRIFGNRSRLLILMRLLLEFWRILLRTREVDLDFPASGVAGKRKEVLWGFFFFFFFFFFSLKKGKGWSLIFGGFTKRVEA